MQWIDILFPGVFVHEAAHALACYVCGVKVHRISVHRASGMVVHDKTNVRSSLLIGLFPLVVGGIISLLVLHAGKQIIESEWALGVGLIWIGISAGFHSIPSVQDVQNIVATTQHQYSELWRSSRNVGVKLTKSAFYALAWVLAWVLVLAVWGLNVTVLFRIGMSLGLWWIA